MKPRIYPSHFKAGKWVCIDKSIPWCMAVADTPKDAYDKCMASIREWRSQHGA